MTVPATLRLIPLMAIAAITPFAASKVGSGLAGPSRTVTADSGVVGEYEGWPEARKVYVIPYGIQKGECDRGLLSRELSAGGVEGAAGGILSSKLKNGDEREAALVGGAIVGPTPRGAAGHEMDALDRRCAGSALEFAPDRRQVHWRNDERRVDYELEPIRTYQSGAGEYCREYQGQVVSAGAHQHIAGKACRQADGSWRIQY